MSGLLVQWNVGRLEIIVSTLMHHKIHKVKRNYEE